MAKETYVQVCALNISANPHPGGIYIEMLHRASSFIVKARGYDYASITKPMPGGPSKNFYVGRILLWTEIDIKGAWLNLENGEELPQALKEAIRIPENARPNFRPFNYAFDIGRHTLYFESRNEFGNTFGPTTAKRVFETLLSAEIQGFDAPDVSVTIFPEDGAVSRILSLDRLRLLQIRVQLPNADTTSPAKRRVIERLRRNHATRLDETYTKASNAESLTPTQDVRELAEVGAEDGFVRGVGRGENGRRLEVSTENYPARYYVARGDGSSFLSRLLTSLKDR